MFALTTVILRGKVKKLSSGTSLFVLESLAAMVCVVGVLVEVPVMLSLVKYANNRKY